MGIVSLDSYRAEAEHFYTTDPDYQSDAAEMCGIIQRDIHDRVVAVDLEATLVSDVVDALYKSEEERVDVFDRLRRPLSDEMLQALVDANNKVILWTSMMSYSAKAVLDSSRLKLPQSVRFAAREDYKQALLSDESRRQVLQKIVEVSGKPQGYHNINRETPEEYYADVYANWLRVKIPSVLGADVLIDDQALDHHRHFMPEKAFGHKEAARFVGVDPFVIGSKSKLEQYLSDDRGLLDVVHRLPAVLDKIDRL